MFIDGSYKFLLTDANDVPVGPNGGVTDNVTSFTALDSGNDPYFESFSGNGSQTVFTTSEDLGTDERGIYVWVDNGIQEAISNGDFATDTVWTKGTGWTIGAGVATATGAISTAISQSSIITLVRGRSYAVTFTMTASAGTLTPSIGGTAGTARNSSGTYTEIIIAGATQEIAFTGAGFTGTLDNVSVKPTTGIGFQILPPTAYTINGTSLTLNTAPASGTGNILVAAPLLAVGAAASSAAAAQAAEASALAAQAAAEAAAANLSGTSVTSVAIGTGTKVFTTQSGKSFNDGAWLLITSDADEVNYMHGQVTTYAGTTLTMNITNTGGSGTFADWTIRVSGTRGATGATGSIDDLSGVPTGTVALADDFFVFQDVNDSNQTKRTKLGTAAGAALIDDDTFATATATNVPSAESVKAYVDTEISSIVVTTDPTTLLPWGDHFNTVFTALTASGFAGKSYYVVAGTAAQAVSYFGSPTGNYNGRVELSSGTQSSGSVTAQVGVNSVNAINGFTQSGVGAYTFKGNLQIPVLSTSVQRFYAGLGVADRGIYSVSASPASRFWHAFRYKDDVNSGNWVCESNNNGTVTTTNTSVAATTDNAAFEIRVNAANDSVTFYIDGVLVATHTTNLVPSSQFVTPFCGIGKTVGTTARTVISDYLYAVEA